MSLRLEDYQTSPEKSGEVYFENGWYLLRLPHSFHNELVEKANELGLNLKPNKNPHISIMKKESPSVNHSDWGTKFVGEVKKIQYSTKIDSENGFHVWINCYSPDLCQMREYFGLPTLKTREGIYRVNFHMTIGKLVKPTDASLREQFRISPQSHIDVKTFMQHL